MTTRGSSMIVGSSRDAVPVVLELCNLQGRLIERFLEDVRPTDLKRFSDIEPIGTLIFDAQQWVYTRHGAGISFEIPGATVDAHVGLAQFPNAIDGWRLLQYLESIGVTVLNFERESANADDENALKRLLEKMARAGILKVVHLEPSGRLFIPSWARSGLSVTMN